MPTDETTLEALAEKFEGLEDEYLKYRGMARIAFDHVDAERMDRNAAEARLIADALRFKLASLTAPAAQEGAATSEDTARLDELERVANAAGGIHLHNGSHTGCNGLGLAGTGRTLRQAVDAMRAARASVRRFADAAASLPRGGADA